MFYRVTADLAFTEADEANDFYHDCQLALGKSQTINPGQKNQEKGAILLHQCFHDQDPLAACITLESEETPAP